MKNLIMLINEMKFGKLSFQFDDVPMKQEKSNIVIPTEMDVMPGFLIPNSALGRYYGALHYEATSVHWSGVYEMKRTFNNMGVKCLRVLYEPDNIHNVLDTFVPYLEKLIKKLAKRLEIPIFLIYGYEVFKSDYFYMITIYDQNSQQTLPNSSSDDYKKYLKILLSIDIPDNYTFIEFKACGYTDDYSFYAIHKKEDD